MSKAQLEKFISVVSNDPALLRKATQAEEDLQKCARNVVAYATAQGYDFTEDEAKTWLAEHRQELLGGELKDSQLDAVAGGGVVIEEAPNPLTAIGGPQPHMRGGGPGPIGVKNPLAASGPSPHMKGGTQP